MSATLAPPVGHLAPDKPYVGHDSYQVHDKAFFFGRDNDAAQVVARALASPYTLLHARSGAGKTSLLNARLIPDAEARGWTPVRTVPYNDPVASLCTATLNTLLVPPLVEAEAIRRALKVLSPDDDDPTLARLIDLYDAADGTDPRVVRPLIAPVQLPTGSWAWGRSATTPFFCRLLRSSIEIERFGAHLALVADGGRLAPGIDEVDGDTSVAWLVSTLSSTPLQAAYRGLVAEIDTRERSLRTFLLGIFALWERTHPGGAHLGLLFILDQFEELFTRFVGDPALGKLREGECHWELRRELFDELEKLHASPLLALEPGGLGMSRQLPLRWVISMRSEYIGQLDELPRLYRDVQHAQYRLRLLHRHQAREAVEEPARHFGYGYTPRALDLIVDALTLEERYVEPANIQVVCEKLWARYGRALVQPAGPEKGDGDAGRCIDWEMIGDETAVRSMVQGTATDFLDELPNDLERAAALDLLSGLITSERTRNVLTKRQLVDAPFRDQVQRERLLRQLVRQNVVRVEHVRGEMFVEIAHELLIDPIMKAMGSVEAYSQFREAMRSLELFERRDFRSGFRNLLQLSELENLDRLRDQIRWPFWAAELMLRSAVRHTPESPAVRYWADEVSRRDPGADTQADGFKALVEGRRDRPTLALYELRELHAHPDRVPARTDLLTALARSWIQKATPREHEAVTYWTRRLSHD
jgi:hypothetical protein